MHAPSHDHDQTADNPLLDFGGLTRFDRIRPEHVTPAIDELLADARARRSRDAARATAAGIVGEPSSNRWTRPPTGSRAPGAPWRT